MQMRCNTIIDLTRTICLEGKFCECVWKFFNPDIVLHYHRSKRKKSSKVDFTLAQTRRSRSGFKSLLAFFPSLNGAFAPSRPSLLLLFFVFLLLVAQRSRLDQFVRVD